MKFKFLKLLLFVFLISISSIGLTNSYFSDSKTVSNNIVSTKCWVIPNTPNLINPIDNLSTNSEEITFNWDESTNGCPIGNISYRFQIFNDTGTATYYVDSDWITSRTFSILSIPEGNFHWQVEAKDSFDNTSLYNTFHLQIYRSIPTAKLTVTNGDWTKEIGEKIDISNFQLVGATQTITNDNITEPTTNIVPYDSSNMIKIGNDTNPGDYLWNNRLMTTFPGNVKTLSLFYNFFSRDFGIWDNPGFYIRLNGQEIFRLNNLNSDGVAALNTDWTRFDYDLSDRTGDQNLIIYGGNTQDTLTQSWAYVDKITTNYAVANSDAQFSVTGTDAGSGIDKCWWKVDSGAWSSTSTFQITDPGLHDIYYYCVNNSAVESPHYQVQVKIDSDKPDVIDNLNSTNITENKVSLSWTSPGDSRYDIRYQKDCDNTDDFNFDTATTVANIPAPLSISETENFDVTGLNKNTNYCFGIKSADQSPNWSDLSNVITALTLNTVDDISEHDVVINEIMWAGDIFVEFRNTTDHPIDMSDFILNRYNGTTMVDSSIDFDGKIIPAYGYLLITKTDVPSLELLANSSDPNNSILYLELENDGNLIDKAWDMGYTKKEGLYSSTDNLYYSMERITTVGDGSDPLSWYTCIYGTGNVRSTPGSVNKSENEPILSALPADPLILATPEATINIADDKKSLSFTVKNILEFVSLNYELSYNTEKGTQGLIGNVDINHQNDFVKNNIILGTCSTDTSCLYYEKVTEMQLKVILTDHEGKQTTLLSK